LPADQLLNQHRTVRVQGEITDEKSVEVVARLLFLQHQDGRTPIRLYIDSLGGSVAAGLAILETMEDLKPPVHTHCICDAHGVAALLLAHGAKGSRSACNGACLSLCAVTPREGSSDVHVIRVQAKIDALFTADTGQLIETIREDGRRNRGFDAPQAVSYGLIDRVED
jgi:ATP-dependent Clp protease, protease subunit